MKIVQDAQLANKTVFLRVDFNVPMEDGEITDNNRIKAAMPTIRFLVESRAKIIIGTHLGRPDGKKSAETSIAPVAKALQRIVNLRVAMAPEIVGPEVQKMVNSLQPGGILVLENLRWDKREEENDATFAKELASYADLYVNDAFAVSHRANASVEAITKFLPSYAGLLIQSEIEHLSHLMEKPESPFVLVIGGVKVKDKAGMIKYLAPKVDKILIGGGVANTFLKASGVDISQSVYDEEMVDDCAKMLKNYKDKIILPVDYAEEAAANGQFKIMDIGEKTCQLFASTVKSAKTVLWNGNLGYTEEKKFQEGTKAVAKTMSQINGKTVIAGGDTAGFVIEAGLSKGISFISTGGGAALEFLAGEKLPGIEALK
ncbi:MAG: phosphoglycerate kinase [Candidatus Berkelbacteria bacterium]